MHKWPKDNFDFNSDSNASKLNKHSIPIELSVSPNNFNSIAMRLVDIRVKRDHPTLSSSSN